MIEYSKINCGSQPEKHVTVASGLAFSINGKHNHQRPCVCIMWRLGVSFFVPQRGIPVRQHCKEVVIRTPDTNGYRRDMTLNIKSDVKSK